MKRRPRPGGPAPLGRSLKGLNTRTNHFEVLPTPISLPAAASQSHVLAPAVCKFSDLRAGHGDRTYLSVARGQPSSDRGHTELTPSSHVLGRPGVRERGFHARLGLRHEEVTVDTLTMATLTMALLTMATLAMATCTVDTLTMATLTVALLTMGSTCAMKNCFS